VNKIKYLQKNVEGLILFAHGSRNPAWRKPFDKLLRDVNKRGECEAVLAFGEFMSPNLVDAAKVLAEKGVTKAVIVPLFLGGGLHVRGDLPKLAAAARAASGIKLRVAKVIGEDANVLRAIADYSIAAAAKVTSTRRKPS
jgi:sirohydrochlorin cobaltochelatase